MENRKIILSNIPIIVKRVDPLYHFKSSGSDGGFTRFSPDKPEHLEEKKY
jgi:hypothetical protein